MTPAQRWGNELRSVMRRRDISCAALGREIAFSGTTVEKWRLGESLPSYESAVAAAEYLHWGRLKSLIIELRTRACERCGRDFIGKQNANQRYCSKRCRQAGYDKARLEQRGIQRRERVGRLLAVWQDVGDRMCREWCPGGREDNLCPDASCPIQEQELCPWPATDGRLERVA